MLFFLALGKIYKKLKITQWNLDVITVFCDFVFILGYNQM